MKGKSSYSPETRDTARKPAPCPSQRHSTESTPQLQKALSERNAVYNRTVVLIEKLEDEGKLTVIRPVRPIEVSRMEKDTSKLTRLYQEGYEEARKLIGRL